MSSKTKIASTLWEFREEYAYEGKYPSRVNIYLALKPTLGYEELHIYRTEKERVLGTLIKDKRETEDDGYKIGNIDKLMGGLKLRYDTKMTLDEWKAFFLTIDGIYMRIPDA